MNQEEHVRRRKPVSIKTSKFSRWLWKKGFSTKTFVQSLRDSPLWPHPLPVPHWVTVNTWRAKLHKPDASSSHFIKLVHPECPL